MTVQAIDFSHVSPSKLDNELLNLRYKAERLVVEVSETQRLVTSLKASLNECDTWNKRRDAKQVAYENAKNQLDQKKDAVFLYQSIIEHHNKEFALRGEWNRFAMEHSGVVHLENNTDCAKREIEKKLPNLSGKTIMEVGKLVGSNACLLCFSEIPAAYREFISTIESPSHTLMSDKQNALRAKENRLISQERKAKARQERKAKARQEENIATNTVIVKPARKEVITKSLEQKLEAVYGGKGKTAVILYRTRQPEKNVIRQFQKKLIDDGCIILNLSSNDHKTSRIDYSNYPKALIFLKDKGYHEIYVMPESAERWKKITR